jgi:hypothetical protein
MKPIFEDHQLLVIDDFLPEDAFQSVWRWLQTEDFKYVHVPTVRYVWRIGDGLPMQGSAVVSFVDPARPGPAAEDLPFLVHPSGKAIDLVIDAVRKQTRSAERLIGREGRDWLAFTASPFVYPQGTGLGWHDDGVLYSGAFTYYAHSRWNASWGGELLVASDDPRLPRWEPRHMFDNSVESEALLGQGMGRYIMPKPNRLIFLRGNTHHMISNVRAAAGDQVRAIVSGFFVRPEGMGELAPAPDAS